MKHRFAHRTARGLTAAILAAALAGHWLALPAQAADAARPAPSTIPQPAPAPGSTPAQSQAKPPEARPVAHFGSLRAEKVNLRAGPGEGFPIEWVFTRRGLPVEILAQFDIWRKIRDSEGTTGWVNQTMLSGHRSVLVEGAVRTLLSDPDPGSRVVARLEPGVVARISRCDPTWCEVKVQGYRGWLRRDEVWGLESGEVVQ